MKISLLILVLYLVGCKNNFNVHTTRAGEKTWFYCERFASGLDNEKLAICEKAEDCVKVCDKAREKDKSEENK